ncbi:MAG: molybdopterin-dependent oxidoreductase [Eggerthellaceae bacterium]|nr:molybdopterin-dependent oxidoreductase [Eggerthellaceae bacterium]
MHVDTRGKTIYKGVGFCSAACGSNLMSIDIDEENDRIIRIRPYHYSETNEDMSAIRPWRIEAKGAVLDPGDKITMGHLQASYKKRIYSPNRILRPLLRVDFDPEHGQRNTQNRGTSGYKEISWDEALDIIGAEMKRIIETYGMTAILTACDGHGETKNVSGTHGCQQRLLSKILDGNYTMQTRQPDSWEGWYWGAKHIWGMDPLGQNNSQTNVVKDIAENGDAVLFWGCDPETTPLGWGGQVPAMIERFFTEIGVKQIHISPDANYSNVAHADKWIPVYPNTDAALQLAIAYVWLTEGTYDADYLSTHAVGFENWAYYVLGGEDGIPKTPKWAEKKCGVPSYTIKALARYWAKHAVSIAHCNGGSFIRAAFAHEPGRLEVALLGMQALGKPGANQFKFLEWSIFGMNTIKPVPGSKRVPSAPAAYRGRERSYAPSMIPKTMIPEALMLGEGERISWYGHINAGLPREDQFTGPYYFPMEGGSRIHMIWADTVSWQTCWNCGNNIQEAFRHENIEFILVQHPWMENDAYFGDIILPSSTKFEDIDMGVDAENGAYDVIYYEDRAIQPRGEAVSDSDVVRKVAEKLDSMGGIFEGVLEKFTEGNDVEDWIQAGYKTTGARKYMSYEEWKEKGVCTLPTREGWEDEPAGLIGFYEDPEGHPMSTPSGKLEYYSSALAQMFPDDKERGPIPRWIDESDKHKDRLWSDRAKDYPFLIVSNHPRWRVHSQHDDVTWLRELGLCKVVGPDGYRYEPVWINPKDAVRIGVKNGDVAAISTERGTVLGGVYVSERIMPNVVYQDHGARVDIIVPGVGGLERAGANNLICPSATTSDNSFGEVTSGFLVNVKKVDVFELARQYPEAFSRPYDKDCGQILASCLEEERN